MNVIHQPSELASGVRQVCVAIGMFDGVHLGHQRVLQQTVEDAQSADGLSVAVTFDRHPNTVVAPARTPPLIYTLSQRLRALASCGVETALLLHFDRAFSQQSGEVFVTTLARDFGRLQSISIGSNFTFGHRRTGNVALLQALGAKLGFRVHPVAPVPCHGHVISSTRCRQSIQAGDLSLTNELLGRPYSMAGTVVVGDRLGRKLGFPTANLDIAGLAVPPPAVYTGHARVDNGRFPAVMNIGRRPTLNRPEPELRAEAHLLDFEGELYGQELEFEFVSKLRSEEKFSSLAALQDQIGQDVLAARKLLGCP
jgi:riboflavin kinase / FMN adenylyltransferase